MLAPCEREANGMRCQPCKWTKPERVWVQLVFESDAQAEGNWDDNQRPPGVSNLPVPSVYKVDYDMPSKPVKPDNPGPYLVPSGTVAHGVPAEVVPRGKTHHNPKPSTLNPIKNPGVSKRPVPRVHTVDHGKPRKPDTLGPYIVQFLIMFDSAARFEWMG